jgi:hypothetical protein
MRIVGAEAARAQRACRGDPTPGWLYGEYQSTAGLPGVGSDAGDARPAAATLARLVREGELSVLALRDEGVRAGAQRLAAN